MFSKIVVPLDGTAESNTALPVARTLARATGGAITLIRVQIGDEAPDEVRGDLARIADELARSDVPVRTVVRTGQPAAEILAEIKAQSADLIVMRTHGRSGVGRLVLGSVAQELLVQAQVPVVLVRPGGRRLDYVRSMLVPVDGSPGGAVALGAAVGLAQATGATVRLLEVAVPISAYAYVGSGWNGAAYVDPAWDEEALAAARTYVDGLRARLAHRVTSVSGEAVLASSIAGTIVEHASEQGCDLIVMSSHALTGVKRAILGSTTDAVVRAADCPVLVVHTTEARASAPDDSPALEGQTASDQARTVEPAKAVLSTS